MLSAHVINLVLFSIPEAIVAIMITLILLGTKMDWKKVVISGIFVGTTAYFVRSTIGITFINIILYTIYITTALSFFKISGIYERFICSSIFSGIYIMIELLTLTVIISFIGIPEPTIASNIKIKFLCFLPQLFIAIGIGSLLRFFRISIFKFST